MLDIERVKGLLNYMKKKMDFWTIEIATKFKDKEHLEKLQKDIIDKFYYECNYKHKDYMAQVVVGVSNINSHYIIGTYNLRTGQKGRPKKEKDFLEETGLTKIVYGSKEKNWHIHIFALSEPSETLARIIKNYIDKNWDVDVSYKKFTDDEDNDIDIGMLFYITEQSDSLLFYGSSDKRFKYSFKQLYEENVKRYSNLKFNKKYLVNEEYREQEDKKFNDMLDYFNTFYNEEKKKNKELAYKETTRRRKIAERYDEINRRKIINKVRKNCSSKKEEYISIIRV